MLRKSPSFLLSAVIALFALLALAPLSCTTEEPQPTTYFDQTIAPILVTSCVHTNTSVGCHVTDAKGNALGNLDLSTYDAVNRRRDLLYNHGPYEQPSLLVKNISSYAITVQSYDGTTTSVTTDIKHVGGPILDSLGSGYDTLRRWIENGASENNSGQPPSNLPKDPCVSADPPSVLDGIPVATLGFDPTHDPSKDKGYVTFTSKIQPYVKTTCAAGNCHGTSSNVMVLLCGDTKPQLAWNFWVLSQYVPGSGMTDGGTSPDASQLLSRPLFGGTFHEGGVIFQNVQDINYMMFKSWVEERGSANFSAVATTHPNFAFFAHRVQPILVRKGCMMMQCHSAAMFHDYRLRGGSGGAFSYFATWRNYNSTLLQMSLDSDDVLASRLVRKNLFRPAVFKLPAPTPTDNGGNSDSNMCAGPGGVSDAGTGTMTDGSASGEAGGGGGGGGTGATAEALGILHRGGPLFEDFCHDEPSAAACDSAGYDYDKGDINKIPAFCVIRHWHQLERAARTLAPLSGIVYVERPPTLPSPDRAQDFDVYTAGAKLHIADATLSATSDVQVGGANNVFDLSKCGLNAAAADVRRPAVSWDATKIAFAARDSASSPLQIYEIDIASQACTKHALNSINDPSGCAAPSGVLVHNFDPAYSPDGKALVFASTRGNLDAAQANVDYCGPQRTPADPSKPNSNLYVYETDPSSGKPHLRQLTYVLNMERYPSFMSDGRLIFTSEKREPGFYQLALRRINLDGGDYHPLYAQRGTIGSYEAIYPIELSDKNFAAIFSSPKSYHSGGQLIVFNRSIGVDFHSKTPADYLVDPSVIDPKSPTYPEDGTAGQPYSFFLHSLESVAQPSTAYTSPAALPGGKMLVSVAMGDPTNAGFSGAYNVVEFDPQNPTAAPLQLFAGGVEAVGIYQRADKGTFASAPDEPNGHTHIVPGSSTADVTILDVPVLASLLFQNTPTGRLLETGIGSFDIYEELPADSASPAANFIATDNVGWTGKVFVKRRLLGSVRVASDGSTHVLLPGGVPIVLHLPDTPESQKMKLPRYQREEMEFGLGEVVNQSMPGSNANNSNFFDGLCGNCHGSVSGRQVDVAVRPDFLTQASIVLSRGTNPTNLDIPPSKRPAASGPPTTP